MNALQGISLKDDVLVLRPVLTTQHIKNIANEYFGLNLDEEFNIVELNSYQDRNYLICGKEFKGFHHKDL